MTVSIRSCFVSTVFFSCRGMQLASYRVSVQVTTNPKHQESP
ncbi:lipoprotein, putative [Nitratidesulfovibrio vulgaris str. Hildenborough]|uniref:Lipoprotein, putative n=1 Tax=Nitratidesulfovibrio vulgaris (strain ATCC 29579 / DSM 644 / CCUG 34227 / NCIMB 8303 / VKM B-1760 / Hildenborough) TaxID=882 RepID=Q72EN6_NITV2|nr:lipoprotein, putative [Nitratidesulfovibrio vulgaris str. Hildenborough]